MAWLMLSCAACSRPHLTVASEVLAAAPPGLLDRVRADPYNYFRLTNREWTARVCEVFAADLPNQPIVQLHGDAHVEQYAFMKDAWGLDDFDDATRGPALVDIVRFLGSIELAARGRGWSRDRDRLFNRFFEGYRRGLSDPAYQPPEPDIVRWEKAKAPPLPREAFFEWAEAKMGPMSELPAKGVVAAMKVFSDAVRRERPGLPDGYFRVVRAGWLQMGVGSAETRKVLIRVEGPSNDPADDVLLEAKVITSGRPSCLEEPKTRPTLRIVQGSEQVGRLKPDILVAGPELAIPEMTILGVPLHNWWIRSWDPTYFEISRDDLRSVEDLSDIVYGSGVQLGAGTVHGAVAADDATLRARVLASLDRLEPRLRRAAETIVQELLRGWHDMGGG